MTTTRIDLGREFLAGLNTPTAEQAGYSPRVDAEGTNLEYAPLAQILLATGTWDGESLAVQVKGSGARSVALPDPTNAVAGFEVTIVDALGNSAAGNITIDPSGSGTIATSGGAAATLVLSTNYSSARLHWIGAGVWVRV